MRIHELLTERDQRETQIMYHGTIDTDLESIKIHGLKANAPRTGFGSQRPGFESFGGVYLTPEKAYAMTAAAEKAAHNPGSRPILIKVQYVVTSGGPDEDLFYRKFIEVGLKNYNSHPYKNYMSFSVFGATEILKGISTPTQHSARYIQEFYEELYTYLQNAKFPTSVDLARKAVEISKSIPRDQQFVEKATKALLPELNLPDLKLINKDWDKDVTNYVKSIFDYIVSTNGSSTPHLLSKVDVLILYFRTFSKKIMTDNILADPELRNIATNILNSARDTSKKPGDVRVDRPIGFRGKTKILQITDTGTNKVLYPGPK